jgi:hypothetical protein
MDPNGRTPVTYALEATNPYSDEIATAIIEHPSFDPQQVSKGASIAIWAAEHTKPNSLAAILKSDDIFTEKEIKNLITRTNLNIVNSLRSGNNDQIEADGKILTTLISGKHLEIPVMTKKNGEETNSLLDFLKSYQESSIGNSASLGKVINEVKAALESR